MCLDLSSEHSQSTPFQILGSTRSHPPFLYFMEAHPAIVAAVGGLWVGDIAGSGSGAFTVLCRWGDLQLPEAGCHSLTQVFLARRATETVTAESELFQLKTEK